MSSQNTSTSKSTAFWPNDTRLVISISMQFEAGGQPLKGTDSPFPHVDFPDSVPSDPAANTWFAYGYREGIPRMLDLWDRHGIKVTSHMIGEAATKHPELAREIVARGHEVAAHGPPLAQKEAYLRYVANSSLTASPNERTPLGQFVMLAIHFDPCQPKCSKRAKLPSRVPTDQSGLALIQADALDSHVSEMITAILLATGAN